MKDDHLATKDVMVLGAGLMGLSTGFTLLQKGASVHICDPYGIAAGSSGGVVGALSPHMPEIWDAKKDFQFRSLIKSRDFWPEVEQISGQKTGYCRQGRLMPLINARGLELGFERVEGAKALWHGLADWDVIDMPRTGWSVVSPTGKAVFDTLSAHIHPRLSTQALAAAVVALGGTISTEQTSAGKIVDATGWAGLEALSSEFGYEVGNGLKGQAVLFDFDASGQPQIFSEGLHFIPHANGTTAVGSTSERYFDHDYAFAVDEKLDDLIAKVHRIMPDLQQAPILEKWAGVRPRAASLAPLMDVHPTLKNRFLVNGGFKIGFGMAPLMGEVMADFILDGTDDRIPDEFRFAATKKGI